MSVPQPTWADNRRHSIRLFFLHDEDEAVAGFRPRRSRNGGWVLEQRWAKPHQPGGQTGGAAVGQSSALDALEQGGELLTLGVELLELLGDLLHEASVDRLRACR